MPDEPKPRPRYHKLRKDFLHNKLAFDSVMAQPVLLEGLAEMDDWKEVIQT